ncbi:MAG: glycogen debranching protein GlgX [Betaproteobacteria bacterium]|nr:glycogen debranching protein GlgX [Betaproteobacteria bacterium]
MDGLILQAGRPWPLGAHWDGAGVNFALFSANAERVELCLFTGEAVCALALTECSDQVWHGYLPGAAPGLAYAYRVYGRFDPENGYRFDSGRLLLDPYARELAGEFSWPTRDGLRSRVVEEHYDQGEEWCDVWGDDAPPATPWADTVLYEIHVKGATRRHPGVPEALRGTYAGLAAPAMIAHLRRLGVTAVNLLPVQQFLDEERLVRGGRRNYWGYNTLAYFVPEPRYAARVGGQPAIAEFRAMVRALHAAGIEVILDVVFNHTAETDESGPTISFRGIDNVSYYRLPADHPAGYENFTGCGNTLNLAHPRVLQLVMDALRYWVTEMHVDGFRFDLAVTLTRDSAFLAALAQDPVLSRVKLIAEPWDLGPDGYRLGRFPAGWSEWNDRFRDDVRAFWLTGERGAAALARRLSGSSDIFCDAKHAAGRAPQAGINFVAAHDGFTLRDLVTYQRKHNEANGEDNRDGHDHNHACNCGCEGECETDSRSPAIRETRRRLQRALLATLFVAQGVPMLQGGDELGRTQNGNNNAYCQDNELTWLDWRECGERGEEAQADGGPTGLFEFVSGLIALRRRFPQLRRTRWLTGEPPATGRADTVWLHPAGHEMRVADWESPALDAFGLRLAPLAAGRGENDLLCLFNRGAGDVSFQLPGGGWSQICDSAAGAPFAPAPRVSASSVAARSVQILTSD